MNKNKNITIKYCNLKKVMTESSAIFRLIRCPFTKFLSEIAINMAKIYP